MTSDKSTWKTAAGSFTSHGRVPLDFRLPEFSDTKIITQDFQAYESENALYDVILGASFLNDLKIILDYDKGVMSWDGVEIDMKDPSSLTTSHQIYTLFESSTEPESTKSALKRTTHILDAKYEKADLEKIMSDECSHLDDVEKEALLSLLQRYETLFDGTLGDFKTEPVHLELKKGEETPVHSRPYPVPHVHEATLKKEVERLVSLGVLRQDSDSEWASPTFIIAKKQGTVRVLTDFRKLNKKLVRKPFPIPKISDIMQKLQGFQYATALDLNMGYYHIRLDPDSQKLCTIIFPWGKYQYLRLPLGVSVSADIFQERMSGLMQGLEFARTYIDDLLCLSNSTFEDHLDKLEQILKRLKEAGLKVNAAKCTWATAQIEYLGYWITRKGIKPLEAKVKAILDLEAPTNVKQTRRVLGIIQYYRDIWEKRSHILAPLTNLVAGQNKNSKTKTKFIWTDECQRAFNDLKKIVARDVMLAYPDFTKEFVLYTDASALQLGAVITQENKPLAFYSRKLNSAQRNYTTTERELLSIVETLKEFRTVLLGQRIIVYTDHKNLVNDASGMSSERVMRWRLMIEEFGPDIRYIKGEDNTVADALSRLDIAGNQTPNQLSDQPIDELFEATAADETFFPLSTQLIADEQQKDKPLLNKVKNNTKYTTKKVEGYDVICESDKLYIPHSLRERTLNWYHHWLCHPGETRMEKTLRQTMTWPGLTKHVHDKCHYCDTCQKFKKKHLKYGKLPPKLAESTPWDSVCVDCIGPYTVETETGTYQLNAMTMIDPATGWFEIAHIPDVIVEDKPVIDKGSARISQLFNSHWLSRYPRPTRVVYDNGSEFKLHFKQLCEDFSIKRKPTTKKNPQANAIIERVHQVVGNMLRTQDLDSRQLDDVNPWDDFLSSVAWAIRSTYHTTLQATPGQLVFQRDMLVNMPYLPDWAKIEQNKQTSINKSNARENSKRYDYDYVPGGRVLLIVSDLQRKLKCPTEGPFTITQVFSNGTVRIQRGAVNERINIRRLKPYFESD